ALARFADIDQVMGDRRPVLALKRQAPLLEQLELDNIGGHGREVVAALCPDGMGPARLLGIDARGGKSCMLVVKRHIGAVAALEAEAGEVAAHAKLEVLGSPSPIGIWEAVEALEGGVAEEDDAAAGGAEPANAVAPGGDGFAIASPSRDQTRGGWGAPDGEPSRTPPTKAHQQILDFQKNSGLMIRSPERWLIAPWSLLSPVR